jgi:hypothetical protein
MDYQKIPFNSQLRAEDSVSKVATFCKGVIREIPPNSRSSALSKIESLLERILDAMEAGDELSIPYQTIRSAQSSKTTEPARKESRQPDFVKFPGRSVQEAKKFGTK